MSKATQAQRSRAARLRKKRAKGKELGPAEETWLRQYETDRGNPSAGSKPAEPSQAGPAAGSPPAGGASPPAHQPSAPAPVTAAAAARREVESGYVTVDFGSAAPQPSAPTQAPEESLCQIKDCPKCKVKAGGQICGTTGEKVFPPMSKEGAEAMARALFAIIGMGIRFFRTDRQFIAPTENDVGLMGRALREMSFRRANWIGAFDDLFMFGHALAGYTMRAINTPPKKKPAALPSGDSDGSDD